MTSAVGNGFAMAIIGKFPYYMRPPYFATNPTVLNTMATLGYHVIQADVDTLDWEYDTASTIGQSLTIYEDGINSGATIDLSHDPLPTTVETLLPFHDLVPREQKGHKWCEFAPFQWPGVADCFAAVTVSTHRQVILPPAGTAHVADRARLQLRSAQLQHQDDQLQPQQHQHQAHQDYQLHHQDNRDFQLHHQDNRDFQLHHQDNRDFQLLHQDNRDFQHHGRHSAKRNRLPRPGTCGHRQRLRPAPVRPVLLAKLPTSAEPPASTAAPACQSAFPGRCTAGGTC